jgi:hypothetical protein
METSDDESTEDEAYKCLQCQPLKIAMRMMMKAMAVGRGRKMKLKKKKGWLRGLLMPDLDKGIISTLVLPSASHTSPCSTLW